MAIYHDRFSDFRDEVRELLISRPVCMLYFQSWHLTKITSLLGRLHGTEVERRSVADKLSLSCARPAADG